MRRSIRFYVVGFTLLVTPSAFADDDEVPAGVTINQLNYGGTGCPQGSVGVQLSEDAQALTLMFDEYSIESSGAANFAPEAATFDRRGPAQPQPMPGRPVPVPGYAGHGGWPMPGRGPIPQPQPRPMPGGNHGGHPGNTGSTQKDKNCTVQLSLNAPAGWAYSLMAVQIRGYANIDAGAWGMQSATYRLGSQGNQRELSRLRLDGPYNDNYQQVFDVPIKNLQWSACTGGAKGLRLDTRIAVTTPRNTTALMTVDSFDQTLAQEYSIIWKQCEGNDPMRPRRGKGFTAACKVLHPGRMGHSREFISWGRGRSAELALQNARQKAMSRCSRGNRGEGNCQLVSNSCQSVEM